MESRIYDISMTIANGMITWPSDGPVSVRRVRSMEDGERLNQSRLDLSAHTGTHIDAPVHFLENGGGVDTLPIEVLLGEAVVLQVGGVRRIGEGELSRAGIPSGTRRLLLKTDNEALHAQDKFNEDYCHITPEGAEYLIASGIVLVGIDYLSIAAYGSGETVHRRLLGAGVVVIEGLDMRGVPAGSYNLFALPLKVAGCDGAPARVVLEELG